MSRLYRTENGRVVATLGEELTRYRHARKVLMLPGTKSPASLFFLGRCYGDSDQPLRIRVNGRDLEPVYAPVEGIYLWHEVEIDPSLLSSGVNTIEFRTDSPAMNAWSIALEPGHTDPGSFLSTDAGSTWRNHGLGYLNVVQGEYVVRMRLAEEEDPAPPGMVREDPSHPYLEDLRSVLPVRIAVPRAVSLDLVREISGWVSRRWKYRNSLEASLYAPWDALTIIAWGRSKKGHNGETPIVCCAHYAVTLITICTALNIPARGVALTGAINGMNGHFVTEVWIEDYKKWVMVDPNMDAVFYRQGMPLSVAEIIRLKSEIPDLADFGPGHEYQKRNPVIADWIRENYFKGICFGHRAVWPRTDFLSHPELAPPGHGTLMYSETDLVWDKGDLYRGFAMFPCFADPEYFDRPPQAPYCS